MESLFLTRDMNEALKRQCIEMLDRWSASIPFSPIKKLGSDTELVSGTELAAYRTTVTTQREKRWLLEHEVPYRGQPLPSVLRSKSDYDVWKLGFRRYADFSSHTQSIDLPDTRRKFQCPRCIGLGRVDCGTCYARGWLTCQKCRNDGKPGWLKHSACGGQGQIKKTRKVSHKKRCGCWDRKKCNRCKGKGTIVVEEKQIYYEPCRDCRDGYVRCDGCPEHEGEVRCSTCGGARQVTCPRCQGEKQVMAYVTAEKSEEPTKNASQHVPKGLPKFSKQNGPLANLKGSVVFTQDEHEWIETFGFSEEPASTVLAAEVERCRGGHAGHILRQRIEVARCSLVEYRYQHSGAPYSIYLNPAHNLVEDLAGPIQALISDTDGIATKAHGAKKYEEAHRLIVRALCMDEPTAYEKTLRNNILTELSISYGLWAVVVLLPVCLVWFAVTAKYWKTSSVPGVLVGLVPLALGIFLFARDLGLRFSGRRARILAATLMGLGAFLSAATIHKDSAQWQTHWTDYLSAGIVTLALVAVVLFRFKERARRTRIEEHADQFANVKALEAYVVGLEPSPSWERSILRRLVGATLILLIAAGLVTYLGVSRTRARADALMAQHAPVIPQPIEVSKVPELPPPAPEEKTEDTKPTLEVPEVRAEELTPPFQAPEEQVNAGTRNPSPPIAGEEYLLGFTGDDVHSFSYNGLVYYYGVVVKSLSEGMPAQNVGLLPGDILYSVDGNHITSMIFLRDYINRQSEKVLIRFLRGGTLRSVEAAPILVAVADRRTRLPVAGEEYMFGFNGAEIDSFSYNGKVYPYGVMVKSFLEGTPAQDAGLLPGDILCTVDGDTIENMLSLRDYINGRKEERILVSFLRGSTLRSVEITPTRRRVVAEREAKPPIPGEEYLLGFNGSDLKAFSYNGEVYRGVKVHSLVEGMPAQSAGLLPGDILYSVDGRQIIGMLFLRNYINQGKEVKVLIGLLREGNLQAVEITPARIVIP